MTAVVITLFLQKDQLDSQTSASSPSKVTEIKKNTKDHAK